MTKEAAVVTIEDLLRIDLDALEREIQELEGNLEIEIQRRKVEIDNRKSVSKVLRILKFGKPERAKRGSKKKPPTVDTPRHSTQVVPAAGRSVAELVASYLMASGPCKPQAIADGVNLSHASVYGCLTKNNGNRFKREDDGSYSIRR